MEIPANWRPTAEAIEALPDPLRHYLHSLHQSGADPAGLAHEVFILKQEVAALERDLEEARARRAVLSQEAQAFRVRVEQWDQKDRHVEEVLALTSNDVIGSAAFDAACLVRPKARILLRDGARVIRQRPPATPA